MKDTTNKLTTWIFKQPIIFAATALIVGLLVVFGYSVLTSLLNIETVKPLLYILGAALVLTAYFVLIKKLPHNDMAHSDFVAITNAGNIIAISIPLITLLFIGSNQQALKTNIMRIYMFQPYLFWALLIFTAIAYLYLFGIGISGLYAKYKRALQIGISKWKIILSWPFGYMLTWIPGYLLTDKKTKSSLTIKTKTYQKFNKWVLSSNANLIFIFLLLLFLNSVIAGLNALFLTTLLLIYYGLWILKHKSDFNKHIDKAYALSAVFINILLIILIMIFN